MSVLRTAFNRIASGLLPAVPASAEMCHNVRCGVVLPGVPPTQVWCHCVDTGHGSMVCNTGKC
ncbi:hypothetical protein ACH5A3_11435 [Streptomyces echinatus]|uniref:hypothetical protein n=1 Tax=Streptomyces echinatus TaxID=67293 RepID=UPI0037905E71